MLVVFEKVLAVFLIILVGFVAGKTKILPESSSGPLSTLMLYITAPCMALSSIYDKELSPEVLSSSLQVIGCSAIYFLVSSLIGYAMVKIFKFGPKDDQGIYIVAVSAVNSGFMGFPVTLAIFGSDIFYLMVMQNIVLNVFMFSAIPVILELGSGVRPDAKSTLKSMANMTMFAVIAGIIMLIAGVRPPDLIDEVISTLGDVTVPLSMIIIGIRLSSARLKKMLSDKRMVITMITSMVVMPLLVLLVLMPMNFIHDDVKLTLVLAAAFPCAAIPVAIAEQKNKNSRLMAEIISLTTFVSLLTLPVFATLLTEMYC